MTFTAPRHWAGVGKKRLLTGSHIETVVEAGMFDRPFGVIAGILAAEHFVFAKRKLSFGIDVLAFCDEEGVRLPSTLAPSMACAGQFDVERLQMIDRAGTILRVAITQYGN